LPAVLEEPIDGSGDALGHAGKTSGLIRRGRAAYGSVAAIIGCDPATGASLVQVISGRVP
jgi:hypothetical protein